LELENRKILLAEAMTDGMTYAAYSAFNKELARTGKTTGPQKEAYIHYTKLGAARMKRWEKLYEPEEAFLLELKATLSAGEQWLVFSEPWCGDAAQNLPFIAKWAKALGVDLRILLRDEHLELMDEFLTNGGRSIPKLVRLTPDFEVLSSWGPRPAPLTEHYNSWRAQEDFDYSQWVLFAQEWYNTDKGKSLEVEFLAAQ
jgi:hypothetical protein